MFEQNAGLCTIQTWTDGYPVWSSILLNKVNGETVEVRVGVNDLHDIRYCIDRILSQIERGGRA